VRGVIATLLLALMAMPLQASIKVSVDGVDSDLKQNVLTFLSVERYKSRTDVDDDTMMRLFNRIDGEVRSALRPYGHYDPKVNSDYKRDGNDWHVTINIDPGAPVRVRHISIVIQGEGAQDPAFDAIRKQTALREGMKLNHGIYEQVKSSLTNTAAANGYLSSRLLEDQDRLLVDTTALTASIDLVLVTGPRYRFGSITIEQQVIRPELMRRFLRFREGDPYSLSELLRTQFALDDSLYFATVDVSPDPPDEKSLTVPIRISATKSHSQYSIGGGYGTDTSIRGTLGWTNTRVNDRGHRFRMELKASSVTQRLDARYDIPIGDPALERFSVESIISGDKLSDLDTTEYSIKPSVTNVSGHWQRITSLSLTRTTTDDGESKKTSNLLVPGIAMASVPEGFLGEALFSRTFYAELIGSHKALGSDSDFLRLLIQSERVFDLASKWHLLLRGEIGASLVKNFDDLPGIYRFFAGGDRSVRGFAYNSLSPEELVTLRDGTTELQKTGGHHLITGTVEFVHDLPRNLAIATFFDFGNAFNKFGDPLKYAAGVGVRYRLPVVSLGLDVAQPLSGSGGPRFSLNISPKL
jgi:translocation and assembly module TamA